MSTLQQWNSAIEIYDLNMGETGDSFNKNIIGPSVMEMLGDYMGKTILDSGCGSGYFAAQLAKKAKKVVGTDFSGEFVKLCRNKYHRIHNLSFEQHNVLEKMTYADNVFDVVISKMVLQYVPSIDIFAKETKRVLVKGGVVVVAVDHPFNTQFYYAQQVAGKPNPRYGVLNDYFHKGEQTKLSLWNKVELTWYPKKVSDYILPFIKNNLVLIDAHESEEIKDKIRIPRVLTFKLRKP